MSTREKYMARLAEVEREDQEKAARKAKRAQKIAETTSSASSPVQLSGQRSSTESLDHSVRDSAVSATESVVSVAPKAATGRKSCLCHPGENRPHDSYSCCKQQIDSIRWTGRVAADTDEDDVARVQALIDSGKVKRAATKAELLQRKEARGTAERGRASVLKEVVNASNKPVPVVTKPELPEGVTFFDPNQAHHFAKCAVLRGLNFQLAARDAYPLLTPFEASVVASVAEKDQNVRAQIEIEASQRGLGESDKAVYVSLLWKHALSTQPQNFQDRGNAMRILSKVFIEGQQQQQAPAHLVIDGISEGLNAMGLTPEVLASVQNNTVPVPDISEDDLAEEDSND